MSVRRLIGVIAACGLPLLPLAAAEPSAVPSLEWQSPCPFEAAKDVDPSRLKCGYLTVPLDWNAPSGGTARLPVAVIRTVSDHPAPDPMVFLSGGPGGAPTTSPHSFTLFAGHAFGKDRDIILFTQRGALSTVPELRCDDVRDGRLSVVAENLSLAERDRRIVDVVRACLHGLARQGTPLHAFSAVQNAQDMRALRQLLGIGAWNLMGVSYGTYMALEAVRLDPHGVRSLILDSIVSPGSDLFMSEASSNFERGMARILESCASLEPCAARFPDLSASLDTVLAVLRKAPLTVALDGPGGKTIETVVNDHDFLSLLHWMLYSPKALPLVPLVIDRTAAGSHDLLVELMNSVYPAPAAAADSAAGAFFAIVCEDQFRPSLPPDEGKGRFGRFAITGFMRAVCADPALAYGLGKPADPVASDIPALILSGRFDPMTPDLYAEEIARTLPNSRLVRVANWGHSTLSGYTACQTDIAAAFLADPQALNSPLCEDILSPPVFMTAGPEAD